jgi:hypothetical protein
MKALLDSGSQANYISRKALFEARLQPYQKQEPYPLHVANRQRIPDESIIRREIVVKLSIHGHQEEIYLDVFSLAAHDIILGLP